MTIDEVLKLAGANKKRKRIGRGEGSGRGKTSGRGNKGVGARAGGGSPFGFEGGQVPLYRRMPKFGGSEKPRLKVAQVVNLDQLESRFKDGDVVHLESLHACRLVTDRRQPVKLLGRGKLSRKLTIRMQYVSQSARQAIEAAGGTIDVPLRAASEK